MIYLPVFSGGDIGNNEIVIPRKNFVFKTEEDLTKANEERPFVEFFPFPIEYTRFLCVPDGEGVEAVEITIGGERMLAISGEWYDGVD